CPSSWAFAASVVYVGARRPAAIRRSARAPIGSGQAGRRPAPRTRRTRSGQWPCLPVFPKGCRAMLCVPCWLRIRSVTLTAMDAVLHALSDASRRTVLDALRSGEATVNELAALLPIARPGVSRHLRVLREAGLVEQRQRAQFRVYRLRAEPLA